MSLADLPKLTIKPYDKSRMCYTFSDMSVQLDGVEVKGLRSLTVSFLDNDANVCIMEFIPGELEIDTEALIELEANIEENKRLKKKFDDIRVRQRRSQQLASRNPLARSRRG